MSTTKKTAPKSSKKSSPIADAKDAAGNVAQVAFDRAKDAIPDMDDVAATAGDVHDYVKDQTNIDFQRMANDATDFVRRNPGTSLAAAAGVGVLLGILATKRS